MSTSEFSLSKEPTPGQVQYSEDRIYESNSTATGIADGELLAINQGLGTRDNHPHGHQNFLLRKPLGEAS